MQYLLKIEGITKKYKEKTALENVSIDVRHGEIFGIIGPNGSGKTTLLKCIAGLLKVNKGRILLSFPDSSKKIKMGILFEQSFHPYISVYDNILQHLMMYGMDKKAAKRKIDVYFSQYNLAGVSKEKPRKLSLGIKQRLALVMALIHEPDIVLLDEPDLGMDIVNLNHLMETLKSLSSNNTTIIISSHNISNIVMLSDRVCLLSKGSIKCIEDINKDNFDAAKSYLEKMFIENYPVREA